MFSLTALKGLWTTRKIWGGALLVVVAIAAIAGGWLYLDTQARRLARITSERDAARSEAVALQSQNTQLQTRIAHAKQAVNQLNRQLSAARQQAQNERRKFDGHDLAELAARRSGLVTRYARRATERVLADLQHAINGETGPGQPLPGSAADRPREPPAPSADRAGD